MTNHRREAVPHEVARTISIIRELAAGKVLTMPVNGVRIGMDEKYNLGILMEHEDGSLGVYMQLPFSSLNHLLNANEIGMVVPDIPQ